jgi:hypothetical protein
MDNRSGVEGLGDTAFSGVWEDGRPKSWPTLQLRIRGRPFDVYCDHPTDVTLDGLGLPVVAGRTATKNDLRRGWLVASTSPTPSPHAVH